MRQFYEQWSFLVIRPPMAGELDLFDFFELDFTHHMEILAKTDTIEECVFNCLFLISIDNKIK